MASTVSSPSSCCSLYALQLGQQADAAALLPHVQDDALAGLRRPGAIAWCSCEPQSHSMLLEDVAGQALAVDAHQHRLGLHRHDAVHLDADAAHAQRQVRLGIDDRGVGDQVELAVAASAA